MKSTTALALLWLVSLVGCASLGRKDGTAPVRGDRREQAMKQFEVHRDTAQYKAALERWEAGDRLTCEAQLKGLVARNPQHLESRQALADLAMERGDMAAAEEQLRELLKLAPGNPQTHHSLGLLLESQQKTADAQQHLRRAAELDPGNTMYQLCLPSDSATSPVARVAER